MSKNTKALVSRSTITEISKDKLIEDLRLVLTDAEELLSATANQAGEGVAVARARIQESLQDVKGRLADTEGMLIKRAQHAVKVTDQYVHKNPWQSIGISAGVGLLIGIMISRR